MTSSILPSPTAGTHVATQNQITWNWNPVLGATGYKWNTVPDYSTAIDLGTATSVIDTGLSCQTAYSRYVWAYLACGLSPGAMLTQSTLTCPLTCGFPFTDIRDGKVYNTVSIGSQCWMAQNLNVGTKIPGGTNQTNNGIIEKYCYENADFYCDTYLWRFISVE